MPRSHLLDRPRKESTEGTRDTHGQVVSYNPLAYLRPGVYGRKEICETLLKTAPGRVHEHAANNSLAVILDESSAQSRSAPDAERGAEGLVRSESPDSHDPGHFEEHGSQGGEGIDVAELTVTEAEILVEAKDSCIAKLWVCFNFERKL